MKKKEITKYIEDVRKYLTEKYGEVYPQWEAIIFLLQDNLDLYFQCRQSIKDNGIFDSDTYKKNPLLSTAKDIQATIIKQIQHLGLSPYSVSKINIGEEDDTDDYIDALLKGKEDKNSNECR